MDIKHFALLDWVEGDLLFLEAIRTHDNASDAMMKTLTRQLFYRYYDTYMGLQIPEYAKQHIEQQHSHASYIARNAVSKPTYRTKHGGVLDIRIDSSTIL